MWAKGRLTKILLAIGSGVGVIVSLLIFALALATNSKTLRVGPDGGDSEAMSPFDPGTWLGVGYGIVAVVTGLAICELVPLAWRLVWRAIRRGKHGN